MPVRGEFASWSLGRRREMVFLVPCEAVVNGGHGWIAAESDIGAAFTPEHEPIHAPMGAVTSPSCASLTIFTTSRHSFSCPGRTWKAKNCSGVRRAQFVDAPRSSFTFAIFSSLVRLFALLWPPRAHADCVSRLGRLHDCVDPGAPENLYPENSKAALLKKDEGAAHSIQARSSLLQQRPNTFAQTNSVFSSFAWKTAADHTFRVGCDSGITQRNASVLCMIS